MEQLIKIDSELTDLFNKIDDKDLTNIQFSKPLEFTLSDHNTRLKNYYNGKGIYFFEVLFKEDVQNEMTKLSIECNNLGFKDTPKLNSRNIDCCRNNDNWFALYVGKNNKVLNRIKNHVSLDSKKTTSALKLTSRDFFAQKSFRVSYVDLSKIKNYEIIASFLERKLRV